MNRSVPTTIAAALAASLAAVANAQPVNDFCAGATPVVDGDNAVDNTGASMDTTLPGLEPVGGPTQSGLDVWYSYTATQTGVRNFEIMNDANNPPITTLALYDDCGGNLLASDIAGGVAGNAKIYHFAVTAGTTYKVRYSVYAGAVSPNVLNISAPRTPVAHDDCELATPISGQGNFAFSSVGLTNSDQPPYACDILRKDGWFAWTPTQTGLAVISACTAVNSARMRLAIYDGCGQVPRVCNSNFNDPNGPSCIVRIAYNVVAGQTYLVRYGSQRMTSDVSGNMLFEVRTPGVGISIPDGAIAEPSACEDAPATDPNGGCNVGPAAVTPINLCSTYTGVTSARHEPLRTNGQTYYLTADSDWYEFTLDTDQTITVTGQSEFPPLARIMMFCPATQLAQSAPGGPTTTGLWDLGVVSGGAPFTLSLTPGTYFYVISPNQGNGVAGNDCVSGSRYWFHIQGSTPCQTCGTSDFNGDGDVGTDQDIEAFFACLGGNCCPTCFPGGADFNGDGDVGTDQDIESFFRVLGGGPC